LLALLSDCYQFRLLSSDAWGQVVALFFFLSIVNAYLFVSSQRAAAGCVLLMAMLIFKTAIILQDYRLALNHHYMYAWIAVTFLFLPAKRATIPALLVTMYAWAGVLKITPGSEWLTGYGFFGRRPLGLPAFLIPAECAYVVVLELVFIWGLLSRRNWIQWTTLAQVTLFHIASFWIVGFFYPLQMFLLLAIIPLTRMWPQIGSVRSGSRAWPLATVLTVSALCIAQLIPRTFPGDPALTGEGRMFALNMFDAPIECRAEGVLQESGGRPQVIPLRVPFLQTRLRCDPIVYLSAAQAICRRLGDRTNLRLSLVSRRMRSGPFQTVVDIDSFCTANIGYRLWRHNSWIRVSEP